MRKYLRAFLVVFFMMLIASASVYGELQKPCVDKANGFQIALPNRWDSQPIPPPTDYESLGVSSSLLDLFKNDTLKPLLIYKCPTTGSGEFQLYKVKADDFEHAQKVVKKYAKDDSLGRVREETKFKLKCPKTKDCIRYKFLRNWFGDEWTAWYFLAENPNGIFLFRYEYWSAQKNLEKKVMKSAQSFKYLKIDEEAGKDDKAPLPPGWSVYETEAYLVQYNEPDLTKVKKYAKLLDKLHQSHVDLLPPNPENEKYRPKEVKKDKFVIKFFKDEKGFNVYAGANGVYGAAAYYSPGQNEIAFYDTGWSKESLSILYHECTHQYLHDFVGGPRVGFHIWVDEGLSEYFFASGMAESGKIKVGSVHKSAENIVKSAMRKGEDIKVEKLISMTKREYYSIGRFAYDHGWALTHYLINSGKEEYEKVLPKYLYSMQAITFPLLSRLAELGEDVSEGLDIEDLEDIEDLDDLEDKLDKLDEKDEKEEERDSLEEKLENASEEARKRAFDGIDLKQLQEDFTKFYK